MSRKIKRALSLCGFAASFFSCHVFAYEGHKLFYFGLGMADGVGSSQHQAGLGSVLHFGGAYQWHPNYQVGIDLTNVRFGTRESDVNSTTTMDAAVLGGYARINFNPSSSYVCYGSAGLGPVFVNTTKHMANGSTTDQTTEGCHVFALGFDHSLHNMWSIGVEGRYIQSWSNLLQGAFLVAKFSFSPH